MALLTDWFAANKLTLNLTRTVCMEFWPVNDRTNATIELVGEKIPLVEVTKFLGVYLDNKLKWNYQTNQLYNKLQANKQLLQVSRNLLDTPTMLKIYYAHIYIYSHLKYGLVVWGSMLMKSAKNELEKIQSACVRTVVRNYYYRTIY